MTPNFYENYGHDYSGDTSGARRAFDLMYQNGYNPASPSQKLPTAESMQYMQKHIPELGYLTPEQMIEIRQYGVMWANENAAYLEAKKRDDEAKAQFNKELSFQEEQDRIRNAEYEHSQYLESLQNYELDDLYELQAKSTYGDLDDYEYITDLIEEKEAEAEKLAELKHAQNLAKRKNRAVGNLFMYKIDFETLDEEMQDFFIAYYNNEIKLSDEFIFVLRRTFNKKLLEFVNPIDLYNFYQEYKDHKDEINNKAKVIREADYYFNFSNDIYADEKTITNPLLLLPYSEKELKDFYFDCKAEVEAESYEVYRGNLSNIDYNSCNHEKAKDVPWYVYLFITLVLSFVIMFEKLSWFSLIAGIGIFGLEYLLMQILPSKNASIPSFAYERFNSQVKVPNKIFTHRAYAYISTNDSSKLIKDMVDASNVAYEKAYTDAYKEMNSYKSMILKIRNDYNKEIKKLIRNKNIKNMIITLLVTLIVSIVVFLV